MGMIRAFPSRPYQKAVKYVVMPLFINSMIGNFMVYQYQLEKLVMVFYDFPNTLMSSRNRGFSCQNKRIACSFART